MGTIIRPELSYKNSYWISKHRYYELKHFCLQYPEWKKRYESVWDVLKVSSLKVVKVQENKTPDPTGLYVEARTFFGDKIKMVEDCARKAAGSDELMKPLLEAVTKEVSYDALAARGVMPVSRDAWYSTVYRRFFWLLDKARK